MHALGMPMCPVIPALPQPAAMQADIGRGDEARLVSPAFGELPLRERLVQPRHRVIAETRVQHQIRAACDHVDGIDLQQAHAFDRRHHIAAPGAATQRLQETLRRQLQQTRLREGQHATID